MQTTRTSIVTAMAAALCVLGFPRSADAAILVTAVESGGDVILSSAGGTLHLGGLTLFSDDPLSPTFGPASGVFRIGSLGEAPVDYYSGISGPSSFGVGLFIGPDSGSGPRYGLAGGIGELVVPQGFVSGGTLGASSATISGATFASLGFTPGNYTWTWGDGDGVFGDTMTLTAVPEPSSALLVGLGAASWILLRRRR